MQGLVCIAMWIAWLHGASALWPGGHAGTYLRKGLLNRMGVVEAQAELPDAIGGVSHAPHRDCTTGGAVADTGGI